MKCNKRSSRLDDNTADEYIIATVGGFLIELTTIRSIVGRDNGRGYIISKVPNKNHIQLKMNKMSFYIRI